MIKILSLALLLAPAGLLAQQADDSVVQWERIVGVITAPNVDNPVAGMLILSASGPVCPGPPAAGRWLGTRAVRTFGDRY